jgi:hypothetical protein
MSIDIIAAIFNKQYKQILLIYLTSFSNRMESSGIFYLFFYFIIYLINFEYKSNILEYSYVFKMKCMVEKRIDYCIRID